jgi:hypothetical protein
MSDRKDKIKKLQAAAWRRNGSPSEQQTADAVVLKPQEAKRRVEWSSLAQWAALAGLYAKQFGPDVIDLLTK